MVGVENVVTEEEYKEDDEIPAFATFTLPKILESETTPYLSSSHEDVTPAKGKKGNKGKKEKKAKEEIMDDAL